MKKENHLSEMKREKEHSRLHQLYGEKSFKERFAGLALLSLGMASVFQLCSGLSSMHYWHDLFMMQYRSELLLTILCVIAILMVEIPKRMLWDQYFASHFSRNGSNPFLLSLATLVSLASIYLSVVGGAAMINFSPDISQAEASFQDKVEVVKKDYLLRKQAIKSEIADIMQRNSYRGNTYIMKGDRTPLSQKEEQLGKLRELELAELAALDAAKAKALSEMEVKETNGKYTYAIAFGLFDLLLLLCFFYCHYYRSTVYFTEYARPKGYPVDASALSTLTRHNEASSKPIPFSIMKVSHNGYSPGKH